MERRGLDGFDVDIDKQILLMGSRAPSHRRILAHVRDIIAEPHSPVAQAFARAWKHRSFDTFYERPLLTKASLRHDALLEGTTHPLWDAIGAEHPNEDAVTEERVRAAIAPDRLGFWMAAQTRRVQTNETSRAVTWLWPAALVGVRAGGKKLALADIGCSAGLNLVAETAPHPWTDSTGAALPVARDAEIVARLGFDTRPLDAEDPDDVRWLRACVWPGETARLRALDHAIEAFRSAVPRAQISLSTASAAAPRLAAVLQTLSGDTVLAVYQTIVEGYLQANERESYQRGMLDLVASAPPGRVLWLTLEIGDETDPDLPATLTATVSSGDGIERLPLARTGYHPVTVDVNDDAVAQLKRWGCA